MSTKMIKEVIEWAERGNTWGQDKTHAARRELKALREAIEAIVAWGHVEIETNDPEERKQVIEARRLLRTIAEEAP